jgi:hypothetical protein
MEQEQSLKRAGDNNEDEQPVAKYLHRMPVVEKRDVIQLTDGRGTLFNFGGRGAASELDDVMVLFARHIASFRNGERVRKHCEPWGERGILYDRDFVVDHKVFDYEEDELLYVTLRHDPPLCAGNNNYYMVGAKFFTGWTDAATRKIAYDAQARADAMGDDQ